MIVLKYVEKVSVFWRGLAGRVTIRRDNGPIDTVATVNTFVATRASYVAQKTLYGYLKTRIGTRYPSMFEDETFIISINIAKMHVFAACLSDLTIFAVAQAFEDQPTSDGIRNELAMACYTAAMQANADAAPEDFPVQDCIDAFAERLKGTDWSFGALMRENFRQSPAALVKWAPIAPRLKQYDTEIVENSIKFAWQEIRKELKRRLDRGAVFADLSGRVLADA